MKRSKKKKSVSVRKTDFWKLGFQKLRKAKKAVFLRTVKGFRKRILIIFAVSFLALAAIAYNEYLFWSEIKMPEKGRGYFFSEDDFKKTAEMVEHIPLWNTKIAVVADAHVGTENGYEKLKRFMKEISEIKSDLIINAGDLFESRIRYKRLPQKDAEKELAAALGIITKNYPVHNIIGNHEVFSMSKDNIKNFTGEDSYYSFNFKGYNFIILDTNFTVAKERDIGPENAVPGADKGFIPKKEKEWLENELKNNRKNIVFSHHSLYSLKNKPELENILKTYDRKIIMTANSHKHQAEIRKFGDVENYDIPSLEYQEAYAIVEIYGTNEKVLFNYFE